MAKLFDTAKKVVLTEKLKQYIDLNTDLGQTQDRAFFEKEDFKLLNFISSVNIPCCVHDGDPEVISDTIAIAKDYHCTVGAHIGYPDPANFGYSEMDLTDEELACWLRVQMGAFTALAKAQAMEVEHIRPHGAMYGAFINNGKRARVIAQTLYDMNPWWILIGPAGTILNKVAEETGIRIAPEVILGKRYNEDGQLVKDLFHDDLNPQGVVEQAKQLIQTQSLTSVDGKPVSVQFKSLHLSPRLDGVSDVADEIYKLLGQPVSLPVAAVGQSGWL